MAMKESQMFSWVEFYQKFAKKLLEYREDRPELIRKLKNVFAECKKNHPEIHPRKNGEHVFDFPRMEKDENDQDLDIDPFTVFGFFNKGLKPENRSIIIRSIMDEFELDIGFVEPIDFDAIPCVYNQRAAFFRWRDGDEKGHNKRGAEDINHLWELFSSALLLAEEEDAANERRFVAAFDSVVENGESSIVKVSMGLFWIAPAKFIALDKKDVALLYKEGKLSEEIVLRGKRKKVSLADVHGENYLAICKAVKEKLEAENRFDHGFVEFSYAAEQYAKSQRFAFKNGEGDVVVENNETTSGPTKHPLNQILFGPPGTGKTYNTIRRAVEIIDGEDSVKNKTYDQIMERFVVLKGQGRIDFVTFHQSYGYEDFIGGIKPTVEKGNVTYEYEAGVFKRFCEDAGDSSNFDEVFNKFLNDLSDQEAQLELKSDPGNKVFHVKVNSNRNLTLLTSGNLDANRASLTKVRIKGIWRGTLSRSTWHGGYLKGVCNHLESKYGLKNGHVDNSQPFVFIIDEINRGNISKIFGELITLIEPSKRVGDKKGEGLRVKLPNAEDGEEDFGVPNNVYIIGTMNTADRSIAMLDTALRRRFEFVEMMPDSEAIRKNIGENGVICKHGNDDGIDVARMLEVMNARIEVLLDREHQIGHAYFLEALKEHPTIENLSKLFQNKIIPLLQEYFYDDYEKIRLVLGDGKDGVDRSLDFIEKISMTDGNNKNLFPHMEGVSDIIGDEKCVYHVKMKTDGVYENQLAYQKIYDGVTLPDDQMTNGAKDEAKGVTA